jgi:F0F1-type ATP synthase assembly protein I
LHYPRTKLIVTNSDSTGNAKVQPTDTKMVPARDLITGGFSKNADLISYILTGLLLGLFFDWVFGTRPLMIILWTLAGLAVGFFRLWKGSEELDEQGKARSHGA